MQVVKKVVKRMRFTDGIQVSLVHPLTVKAVQGFGELETAVIEKHVRMIFRLDRLDQVMVESVLLENGRPCFQVPIDDADTLAGAETLANVLNETMLKTGGTEDASYKVAFSIFRAPHNQSSPSTHKFPKASPSSESGGKGGDKGGGKGKGGGSNRLSPAGQGGGKGKGGGRGRGGGGVGERGGERGRDGGCGDGRDGGGGVGGEKRATPPSKGHVGERGGERGRDGGGGDGGDDGAGVGGQKRASPPGKGHDRGHGGGTGGRGRGGGGSLLGVESGATGGGVKRTAPHGMGGGSSVKRTAQDGGEHGVELVQSEAQGSSIHVAAAMESEAAMADPDCPNPFGKPPPAADKGKVEKHVQVPSSAWAHSTGVCPASPAACPGCPLCTRLCAPMQAANKCMYDTETNQIGSSESPQKCVSSNGLVQLRITSEVRVLLWFSSAQNQLRSACAPMAHTEAHTHKHIHMLENLCFSRLRLFFWLQLGRWRLILSLWLLWLRLRLFYLQLCLQRHR